MIKDKKIAIFFDCENISSKYLDEIFSKFQNLNSVIIRHAYKDWSDNQSKSWSQMLSKYAIKPIQTNKNISSKNVSDFQIVIDVMNIINESKVDTIVLVSSDSDFTSLAIEIRSKGLEVIGFGEDKSHKTFNDACNIFHKLQSSTRIDIVSILKKSIITVKKEKDGVLICKIGTFLKNNYPTLKPKDFDVKSWSELFRKYPKNFKIFYEDERRSKMIVKTFDEKN